MPIPTDSMAEEAQRGLDWRKEFGRGGTPVGIARARDIARKANLSDSTVQRMFSFFSRHEVDKQAEGFRPGEDGYPSNGRIAWALWGGDPGFTWAKKEYAKIRDSSSTETRMESRPYPNEHAARIFHPEDFDDFRRETDFGGEGSGIDAIFGIKEGVSLVQSLRFDAEKWTPAAALEWLDEHEFEVIKFEEAAMEESGERHIVSISETEETVIVEFAKAAEEAAEEMEEMSAERKASESVLYRSGTISGVDSNEDRTFDLSISSETPVEREFGYEVLSHSKDSVDLSFLASGNAPVLLYHDTQRMIGRVLTAWVDPASRKLRAKLQLGTAGESEQAYQEVKSGILRNVSIGYRVGGMEKTDEEIEGRSVYKVTKFRPLELSFVSIPADESVGVGRASEIQKSSEIEVIQMEEKNIPSPEEIRAKVVKENAEIVALGAKHNKRNLADDAIAKGLSVEQFRGILLDNMEGQALEKPVELTKKEERNYSLISAIRSAAQGRFDGFEREVSDEIARSVGKQARGFYVPSQLWGQRTLQNDSGSTYGAASNVVTQEWRGDAFIESLVSASILSTVGATIFPGLNGEVTIPRMSSSASAGFIAEGGSVGNNEPAFDQVTMTSRTLANKIAISRTMLSLTSNPQIEAVLRDNMTRVMAAKIDNVALKGGGSNEPTGILSTSGIGDVSSGGTSGNANLTYGNVVDIMTEVSQDNAMVGNLAWVTHPAVVGKLMQTTKIATYDAEMILSDMRNLLGYPVVQTTQMPSSSPYALLFGNFADLYVGFFGALDVLIDPYGSAGNAITNMYVFQDTDIAVAHAESFAAAQDVTVA
jgi:HK97 family phage major capsid protein/HK97 family phage prohead protease